MARAVSRAVGLDGEVESLSLTELSRTLGPAMRQDFLMNVRASGEKARSELGWDPHRPDLADELASLPCPVDPSQYYPGPRGPLPARSAAI